MGSYYLTFIFKIFAHVIGLRPTMQILHIVITQNEAVNDITVIFSHLQVHI